MRIGKVKESILKRSVLRQLNNNESSSPRLVFPGPEYGAFPDEVKIRINPVEGWTLAAERAVYGAVNALAADQAVPKALAVTVLMPAKTEEKQLKALMKDLAGLCRKTGIVLADGHTAVTPVVGTLLLNVAAFGVRVCSGGSFLSRNPEACPGRQDEGEDSLEQEGRPGLTGMDILMTGTAGREGAALLAIEKKEELMTRYAQSYIQDAGGLFEDADQTKAADILWAGKAAALHDIREGGVFGALWELAVACKVGLDIDLKRIPIRQHIIEICEFFGLNPYMLLSGGCLLAVVPDGARTAEELKNCGITAEIIGRTTDSNDRLIRYDTETRFLEPPKMDEIYKIERF